ncbi:MAG: hypothetical protein A2745_00020 [Candidatus Harrisonbacteria bacterium RIFCSPHIGHO2_01_FULL_44_13]|uniref:Uncharacterized protein n=1 Tax=Candidatus Harrisonbacteria bacterium RIFCSPLOWO2_01_FULL_44_18 TaxID=1798407 RepID=A0A1G1ZNY9_9BACT|nr:MAG: hypothetical protein A2745_00020 [Candidatus Harrisonbacteria bacterium RIFCSPHIGHO2_01_FULL_44_13]OGY66221.1 MAG: hypothetical protein A3A16_03245 [Candidatus Harrisonbacteria bacterium RIFCSPLOWO2_01_FULL_44_18]
MLAGTCYYNVKNVSETGKNFQSAVAFGDFAFFAVLSVIFLAFSSFANLGGVYEKIDGKGR